ncbi:hypothetical protein ACLOJK_024065, partial [Asimina triloba]
TMSAIGVVRCGCATLLSTLLTRAGDDSSLVMHCMWAGLASSGDIDGRCRQWGWVLEGISVGSRRRCRGDRRRQRWYRRDGRPTMESLDQMIGCHRRLRCWVVASSDSQWRFSGRTRTVGGNGRMGAEASLAVSVVQAESGWRGQYDELPRSTDPGLASDGYDGRR